MSPLPYRVRVVSKRFAAVDISTFELACDDAQLPAFSAGSHIDVEIPGGLVRQYSLCNDPKETHRYLIGVLKDPSSRGGSKAMHESVKEGDFVRISAPKNHFPLAHEAEYSILLAGGIGITPILCMAERLAASRSEFALHYCARTPDRMAFHDRIRQSEFSSRAGFHFDDGEAAQRLDLPSVLSAPSTTTHLYVCGPKGFIDAVLTSARTQGWSDAQLHHEYFSAGALELQTDGGFDVKIASSNRIIRVDSGMTIVKALANAGIEVQTSCEQGICGTCLTRVIAGEPDHRDFYLTNDEHIANDQIIPCCSRAKSPLLVLDL